MKKLLQHKWIKRLSDNPKHFKCEKCGCEKIWDFSAQKFYYETKRGATWVRPPCKLPTFTKFPREDDMLVGGYDGGEFYKY
jgi:hypothetical protein